MLTVRQIERLWTLKAYPRLIDELSAGRAEAVGGIRQLLHGANAAAALTVIRLGELHQSHQPVVGRMLRHLLACQHPAGGFGDASTTALAIRALAAGQGAGEAIDRALDALCTLQRPDGEWPASANDPAGDPATTAFVILQLVESRLEAARALVNRTMDRLTADEPVSQAQQPRARGPLVEASFEQAPPAPEPLLAVKPDRLSRSDRQRVERQRVDRQRVDRQRLDVDRQLLPLRRRTAAQAPELAASWA